MSLIKVIQPWLKQNLSDHLLDPTVELLVKQLEVYKEVNIAQAKTFLNHYVSNNSYKVCKQLASELKKYIPADADTSLNESDIKKKKKELKQLLRQSSRNCEDIKIDGSSFNSEGDIYFDEQLRNAHEALFPPFPSNSIQRDITLTTQDNARQLSTSSTLQVKPLHKLIKEPLLINSSIANPVPSNDLRTSAIISNESSNSNNDFSVLNCVPERRKRKKKRKSKGIGLDSSSLDKEPIPDCIETVNNLSGSCDQNVTASISNSVINSSNEQVPDNSNSNSDRETDMFLKLLDFVKSLSKGRKKKILEDIFCAMSNSIEENCAPLAGDESTAPGNVSKTKSKKKKKNHDKSREKEEIQPKDIIFLDITEDQDDELVVERCKKHKNKNRDKRKESQENETMVSSQEVTDVVSMGALENMNFEGNCSSKKKRKEASHSHGSELEEGVMHIQLNEDIIVEYYEEPPKKKKKKKKSKLDDFVEEELMVPAPSIVPQISGMVENTSRNKRRRSLSGTYNEGEETSQENTISSSNLAPSKNSCSNSFTRTLYDYENLISESVINKQPNNPSFDDSRGNSEFSLNQRSERRRYESGGEPSPNHQITSSNNKLNQDGSSRSSPCQTIPPVTESDLQSNGRVISNPFPSFELLSRDSSGESDSSVEIVDHILEKVKTEPMSPTGDDNLINTQETVSAKKSQKKPPKNPVPINISSEVLDQPELDDKDMLHNVENMPDIGGNGFQNIASRIEVSSDIRQQGRPEVTLEVVERPEVTQSNLESGPERICEISAESAPQSQYESLEKELLELEQCLYLANKAGEPERAKSNNSAVPAESVDDTDPSCSSSGAIPILSTTGKHDEPEPSTSGIGTDKRCEQKFECFKCGQKFDSRRQLCQHWIKHVKEKLYDVNMSKAPVQGSSTGNDANRNLPDICLDSSVNKEQPQKQPPFNSGKSRSIVNVDLEAINDSPQILKQSTPSSSKTKQLSSIALQQIKKEISVNFSKTKQQSVGSLQGKKQLSITSSKPKLKLTANSSLIRKSTTNSSKTKTKSRLAVSTNTPSSPLKCPVCLTDFKNPVMYSKHVRKHAKPYKCSLCNSCFKSDKSLKRHLIKHSNKKPHK